MPIKLPIIISILLLLISCKKHEKKVESSEVNIEKKIIKETITDANNNIFHIDAKIPIIKGLELGFEELIKEWKIYNETEFLKTRKSQKHTYEFSYYSNFEIFANPDLKITSILYSQYTTAKNDANGLTTYHPVNLRGQEKIKLSNIISKDQLDSLIQVLREQVKKDFRKFSIYANNESEFEKEFEEAFKKYKYYFKNNNVIIFYDTLIIGSHSDRKAEFTFPIDNTNET
ncbi:DUF3298 domain-containing protein [Borrelia anserina]|uniref:Lipoprotein n=2 Tax=Borrelia anserina TaxID=143 RepID=W5SNF9_BORAN|nr:hypothetical protein [Borrelia anserina]AHH08437.1 Hypothetical protein BAN_0069100 [Borrelia anserina BA2]APR64916.1 hypothetical protein N187_02240 [Borrelia anserina Es]UPA06838.1 DUF3298 domain-containing protein [Borrelia anserina]